jgi:hyperosmotically inducible periplasmic protein
MLRTAFIMLSAALLAGCHDTQRQQVNDRPASVPASTNIAPSPLEIDADNSTSNVHDSNDTAALPESEQDAQITADIRSKIIEARLSVNAQKVKVITRDGRVTLRGLVDNSEEKTRIEELARNVAGDKINSELEIMHQK